MFLELSHVFLCRHVLIFQESLPLASTITRWHKTLNVMTDQYRTLKENDADMELPLKTVTSHFFDELYR